VRQVTCPCEIGDDRSNGLVLFVAVHREALRDATALLSKRFADAFNIVRREPLPQVAVPRLPSWVQAATALRSAGIAVGWLPSRGSSTHLCEPAARNRPRNKETMMAMMSQEQIKMNTMAKWSPKSVNRAVMQITAF
jgi:hypothetical protein